MNLFNRFKTIYAPWKLKSQFMFQSLLKNKKYLALGFLLFYTPMAIATLKQHQKQTTIMISKNMQKLSEIQIPKFMRSFIFRTYSWLYSVKTEEMLKKFDEYKTFSQFFTRKINQRPISKQKNVILSPSDSRILAFGEIKSDSVFVVKGYEYSLGHLLCGEEIEFSEKDIRQMKKRPQNKLYHLVLYLAPGDYHRFHAATNFEITRRKAIDGALFSVKQKTLVKKGKVYERNSRLILHGKWSEGYLGMILVGALNVGRIVVKEKLTYEIGEQIGYFNLGSTIVLIIESPEMQWQITQRQRVRYGEVIGRTKEKVGVNI